MKIILKRTYGKGTKIFNNKSDMLDYIKEHLIYNCDDYDSDVRFMGLPRNFCKWNIYELVDYFFGDYERVKEK